MDLATLALKVDHSDVSKGTAELDKFSQAATKTEQVNAGLVRALGLLSGGALTATAVIGTTTSAIVDMYRHTDMMRDKAQDLAHTFTAAGTTAQALADQLRPELAIMRDLESAGGKGAHALDRMEVIKAKLYALGPDYRKMIDDEVMGYGDLLKVIDKINAATLKRIELQIREQESQVGKATRPGWMQNLGTLLGGAAGSGGLGGYLWLRGLDADLLKLNEENEKLNKLFSDRAKLMEKSEFKAPKGKPGADLEGILWTDRRPYKDMIEDLQGLKALHERTVPDFQIATTEAMDFERTLRELHRAMAEFDQVQSWADPLAYGLRSLKNTQAELDANRGLLGESGYLKGLEKIRLEELRLRAESGDTWAIIGYTVTQNAGMASNALASWMDNMDGLGRSWTTLGNTVRNVIADMLRQMERAIIEQKVMNSAMGWISGLFTPTPSVGSGYGGISLTGGSGWSTSGGVGAGGFTGNLGGLASGSAPPMAASRPRVSSDTIITVHVESTGNTTTEANTAAGIDLARRIAQGEIRQWQQDQMRSGGVLSRN